MTGLPARQVQVMERIVRRTPLAMRVRDLATGKDRIDGLLLDVAPIAGSQRSFRAFQNASGVYCAMGLPGLAEMEHADIDEDAAWALPTRDFLLRVSDPENRFLPMRAEVPIPARGLLDPLAALLTQSPLSPLPDPFPWLTTIGSPQTPDQPFFPLFSAPERPRPDALAEVRAELREHPSGRPAAWALLEASIGGAVRGLGLTDQQGRVALYFPYPPSPRPALTSPVGPRDDFRWDISLTAYSRGWAPDEEPPQVPRLDDILQQLDSPRQPLAGLAPPQPLGDLPLDYGFGVIARTQIGATEPSPYLFIEMT